MSKDPKQQKKKPVVNRPAASTVRKSSSRTTLSFPLLFEKQNYLLMIIGVGLIIFGMILMLGGEMKDPNVWDESVIYSFRRTVLAPIFILAGLAVEVYAILKKPVVTE